MNTMNENLQPSVGVSAKSGSSVRVMTTSAVCVALLAVSAYISFPLPFTPAMVTALTIMVNLVAFLFKPKQAGLIILIWMLLGIVGVPVFVGGTSGLAKVAGPTGGFIWGFIVAAMAMSAALGDNRSFKKMVAVGIAVGMIIIYACGALSMYFVAKVGIWKTLVMAVFPFIIGDVLKVLLAAFIANRVKRYVF